MKALLAITCIAILAAIAYLGWGEWQRAQQASAVAVFTAARQSCQSNLTASISTPSEVLEEAVSKCVADRMLTAADIATARSATTATVPRRPAAAPPTPERTRKCEAENHAVGSAEMYECMTAL